MATITSKTIRGYTVIESIGKGGYGAVYRAFQPAVKREVAIKIILPEYANDPDFIRGFETEAELIARLEHFHIIPLYDYWREPNGAYLVTRFLKGGSLRSRLDDQGSLSAQETVRLSQQICSALAVAHKHGVIHRDIKPANILLDEEGNAYLGDFGISIAVESSDTADLSELIGTPAYLAPEQIMMEKVGPHSDIYSFGIVLYECLTGHRPYPDDASPIHLMQMTVNEPIPSLCDLLPDLPHAVEKVIFRATAKDPTKRYTNALDLALDFRKAFGDKVRSTLEIELAKSVDEGERTSPLPRSRIHATHDTHTAPTLIDSDDLRDYDSQIVPNPYKGLRAFQEADADDFFGRTALIDQLIYRMEGLQVEETLARFLALVGPSGSGKSSVVKAGLVPALRRGKLHGSENWFVVEMFPSTNPFEELEAALLKIATDALPGLLDQLKSDERGLIRAVKRILPSDDESELLLIIDQFEELFTLVEDTGLRQAFVDNILAAIHDPRSRIRIITTLRADFYDRPLQYEDLGKLLQQRTEVVLPLSTDEIEAAIIEPAKRMGVTLETGLVDAIVTDVGEQPGTLPLLQFALTDLFERRVHRQMTLSAYRDSGGVLGVLARRADELYNELDETSQAIVRQITLRLVTLGTSTEDTRRRVRRSEITIADADEAAVNYILDLFGKYRLLTFDRDPITREPTIEVAHEALIRTWTRLQEWVDASREDLKIQRRLTTAARDWDERGRDPSYLSLGVRLAEFQNFATTTDLALSLTEHAYLDASRQHEQVLQTEAEQLNTRVKRLRRIQYISGLAALLALIALVWISIAASNTRENQQDANNRLNRANTQVQQVDIENSRLIFSNTQVAHANATADSRLNTASTQVALAEENLLELQPKAFELEAQQILANNGKNELAALLSIYALNVRYSNSSEQVLYQSLDHMRVRQVLIGHTGPIHLVTYSPDGQTILTGSGDGSARLWDANTGRLLHILNPPVEFISNDPLPYTHAAFSPDGRTILTESNNGVFLWDVETGNILFEWHLANDEIEINSIMYSPDGNTFLTSHDDGSTLLWDAKSFDILHRYEGFRTVWNAVFSPDGSNFVLLTYDEVRLWDVETGQPLHTLHHPGSASQFVAYSPDGQKILTGGDGTARIWDVETGETLHVLEGHSDEIYGLGFSPDGRYVVTCSNDFTARLWDVETGETIHILDGYTAGTSIPAFSPDGKSVLVGSLDGTARIWDVETGETLRVLEGHSGEIWTTGFSPDGQSVFTGSTDGTVRIWDIETDPSRFNLLGHTNGVNTLAFSPDGQMILSGSRDHTARLWTTQTGEAAQVFLGHSDEVVSVAISPDGQIILSRSQERVGANVTSNQIHIWDVETGEAIRTFEHSSSRVHPTFSPDGQWVLTMSSSRTLHLSDVTTSTTVDLEGHSRAVTSAFFSPDGQMILTGSWDNTAHLWDVETGEILHLLEGHNDDILIATFSPDGQTVLTGSKDNTARLWDVETGKALRIFLGHTKDVLIATFSPDGQTVLTGSEGNTARLWDVNAREVIHIFEHMDRVEHITFSPGGQMILTGSRDKTARLWATETGELIHIFEHAGGVEYATFSPDGSTVLTQSTDGFESRAHLWDTTTGELIKVLQRDSENVLDVAFSPDGSLVATAGSDGVIRIWYTDYHDLIDYACSRMFRDFTPAERAEFGIDDTPTCPKFATE